MTLTHCEQCGMEHEDVNTQIGFEKPDAYFDLPESERERRVFVHSDICDIDRKRFFARGVLQIPVQGHEHFGWGIWVEMGRADFLRYVELYNDPDQGSETPFHGHIATSIPAYCETTLGIPVTIQLTGPTTRPLLFVEAGVDHLLAREQSKGIEVDRLDELRGSIHYQLSPSPQGAPHEGTVRCAIHGLQQETFVCQHIAQGLVTKTRVGFFWSTNDPNNQRPDAWCRACEERVQATGGEWVGEAEAHLEPKVLCGACYDLAKKFHMGEDPSS